LRTTLVSGERWALNCVCALEPDGESNCGIRENVFEEDLGMSENTFENDQNFYLFGCRVVPLGYIGYIDLHLACK
jgi:hypothetical protein